MAGLGEPIHHRGPIVRVDLEDLARWGSLSGVGPAAWIRFEHEVSWLREPSAEIYFRHGGKHLKDGPRFCDHPGYLSGLEAGVREAVDLCAAYEVTSESSLEIVLEVAIQDVPYLKARPPYGGISGGAYFHPIYSLQDNWFHFDEVLMEAYSMATGEEARHTAWMALRRLAPQPVVESQVIWSSKVDLVAGAEERVMSFLQEQRAALADLLQPSMT